MALNSNIEEEDGIKILGFKSALFINVPNWKKDKNTKACVEIISADNTPDVNKVADFNKSMVSNLISRDLMNKLEEESPSKPDEDSFMDSYFENQHFYSYGRKLSFDEEDLEETETKTSKQTKLSKDSNYNSSCEKMNAMKQRKSNSLNLLCNSNHRDDWNNFTKKYPSSMDNNLQILKSKENQDSQKILFNEFFNFNQNQNKNSNNNSNSNSKNLKK